MLLTQAYAGYFMLNKTRELSTSRPCEPTQTLGVGSRNGAKHGCRAGLARVAGWHRISVLGQLEQSTTAWAAHTTEMHFLAVLEAGGPSVRRARDASFLSLPPRLWVCLLHVSSWSSLCVCLFLNLLFLDGHQSDYISAP